MSGSGTRVSARAPSRCWERQGHSFEALHGGQLVQGPVWLERMMARMAAIARIDHDPRYSRSGARQPLGTGFLIDGGLIARPLKGRKLLVTNEHVLSAKRRPSDRLPAIGPSEAMVEFTYGAPGEIFRVKRLLWLADRYLHDVVICLLDRQPEIDAIDEAEPGFLSRLEPAPESEEEGYLDSVTVIGHPRGRALEFPVDNLRVVRHDGPDLEGYGRPVRLLYKSPTEPGHSGSPVFDWRSLRLVGVHHAGRGRLYRYEATPSGLTPDLIEVVDGVNEAVTFESIARAILRTRR